MTLYEKYQSMVEGLHLLIIHPRGDRKFIEVIDNQFHWEIDDFDTVTKEQFHDLDEAIFVAKKLADKKNIVYVPFESRYCGFREVDYGGDEDVSEFREEYRRSVD